MNSSFQNYLKGWKWTLSKVFLINSLDSYLTFIYLKKKIRFLMEKYENSTLNGLIEILVFYTECILVNLNKGLFKTFSNIQHHSVPWDHAMICNMYVTLKI